MKRPAELYIAQARELSAFAYDGSGRGESGDDGDGGHDLGGARSFVLPLPPPSNHAAASAPGTVKRALLAEFLYEAD